MSLKRFYNEAWKRAFNDGVDNFGDLELSKELIEKAKISKKDSILEIGCGIGELGNELYRKGFKKITCVDVSDVAISYGKKKFPHLNLIPCKENSLGFPSESFDVCLSFDLLEHLSNVEKHLDEVKRVLKPWGRYIFQTPNILSNPIIETVSACGFSWRRFHPSLQSSFSIKRKLANAGFRKVEFVKIPPLSQKKLKAIVPFLAKFIRFIPWKHLPIFLQTNFYIIAYK